jgi:protein-disulfide isomerase
MTTSRRDAIKAQRTKRKRQQRIRTLLVVGGVILVIIVIIVLLTNYSIFLPKGNIVEITPIPRTMESGKAFGNPDAKVKVLGFEDFQCPVCKEYTDTVELQLVSSTYITSGQVYYEFMQFPFIDDGSLTKESHQAANASMCALEQGRFWDYHDILFANQGAENQGSFNDARLKAFAQSLGLNMNKFNACFSANKYSAQIDADYQQGVSMGVSGTPTVFVNGTEITPGYAPTWDQLKSAIDTALAAGG